MLWAAPDLPVFVDGRTDLYQGRVLEESLRACRAEAGWREVLARRNPACIFVRKDRPLVAALCREPGWGLAYYDSLAAVFVRDGTSPALRRLRLARPEGPPASPDLSALAAELEYLIAQNDLSFDAHLNLASVYAGQGRRPEALREVRRCLELRPAARDLPGVRELLARLGPGD